MVAMGENQNVVCTVPRGQRLLWPSRVRSGGTDSSVLRPLKDQTRVRARRHDHVCQVQRRCEVLTHVAPCVSMCIPSLRHGRHSPRARVPFLSLSDG